MRKCQVRFLGEGGTVTRPLLPDKGQGRFRSITFPDPIKPEHIQGRFIQLPKIGKLKLILHRPLPDGFKVKTAAIIKKVDGYYITLSLQLATVPALTPDTPKLENTIGIDMGLKSFLVDDSGLSVSIPQHYRSSEKRLKRLQRSLSRKKKGSNRRKKAIKRVGKAHLKVSNTRKDFHYKTAKKLLSQGHHVAHEKLNIKGLAKSRLAKSVNDAGWGQFLQILSIKRPQAFPPSHGGACKRSREVTASSHCIRLVTSRIAPRH